MNPKLKNLELECENKRLRQQNLELINLARAHAEALIKAKKIIEEMLDATGEMFQESEALQKALTKEDYVKEDEPYENISELEPAPGKNRKKDGKRRTGRKSAS